MISGRKCLTSLERNVERYQILMLPLIHPLLKQCMCSTLHNPPNNQSKWHVYSAWFRNLNPRHQCTHHLSMFRYCLCQLSHQYTTEIMHAGGGGVWLSLRFTTTYHKCIIMKQLLSGAICNILILPCERLMFPAIARRFDYYFKHNCTHHDNPL